MDGSAAALESAANGTLGAAGANAGVGWTSQMTINSPGMDGQAATVRVTLHGSGDASGSTLLITQAPVSPIVTLSGILIPRRVLAVCGTQPMVGPAMEIRLEPLPSTRPARFGQPCEIAHSVSFAVSAGTGEPDFGDPQDASAQGAGSLRFSSGSVQVLDPTNNNAPVSYTMVSNVGSGAGQVTPAGATYAGFSVTNSAPDAVGSTFQLLDGTASHDTNVTATFVAPPEVKAGSDTVDLNGTDGDLQVVQIDWDLPKAEFPRAAYLPRGCISAAKSRHEVGQWSARELQRPSAYYFSRAYNPATDFHLGYAGFDTANHKVWAVINHNSLFAAAIPFDLVSVVSRKTHGTRGDFDINLPLSGTPGVESRSGGANGDHYARLYLQKQPGQR